MDPDATDEVFQENKRIKVDEMSFDMESLRQQHRDLLENEYHFLETQLNGFKNRFVQSKNLLMRFISQAASPQLKKRIDVLEDIQKKQEILYQDLDKNLLSIKNEAFEVQQKEIDGMSPADLVFYFKHRINFLQKMQHSQKHENVLANESCSTEDSNSVDPMEGGSLSATSDAQSPASELLLSQSPSATLDLQLPSLLSEAGEEGSSIPAGSCHRDDKDCISDPLQLQLRRLAQYRAMKDCPLHYKFIQKLRYANDLILFQHEQLTITSALQQEIWNIKERELQKTIQALVPPSLEQVKQFVSLPTLACSSSENQSGNMFSETEPLSKNERKVMKQLKKEKKRQEKMDKLKRDPTRCQFFVAHKKRYCRMLVVPKKLYCGQHLVMDQVPDDNGNIRIPCPLDPKHSVYQHQLGQHLTVCNARAPTHLPYYCAGRNCGPLHDDQEDESIRTCNIDSSSIEQRELIQHATENASSGNQCALSDVNQQEHLSLTGRNIADLTDDELLVLIKRVTIAEKDHTEAICKEELLHSSMEDHLQNKDSSLGPSVRKHLLQNASLVAHLEAAGAFVGRQPGEGDSEGKLEEEAVDTEELEECTDENLSNKASKEIGDDGQNVEDSPSCFLEFGAGKGQLSHWVANASSPGHPLQTVLIDRGSQRYKFDSRINEAKHVRAVRLRVDIADLALERVEGVQLTGRVFAGGKHLCGAATDLSVRCLLQSGVLPSPRGQRGLVIALCCHHRCSWQHYTGKSFLERVGLGAANFPALLGLSSWAVCEARPPAGAAKRAGRPGPGEASGSGDTTPPDVAMDITPSSGNEGLTDGKSGALAAKEDDLGVESSTGASASRAESSDGDSSNDVGQGFNTPSTSRDTTNVETSHDTKGVLNKSTGDATDSLLGDHDIEREDAGALNRYVRLGLSIAEREEIGRAAKHLINHGRLLHLRKLGLQAKLVYYVDRDVTLENVAIVAHS